LFAARNVCACEGDSAVVTALDLEPAKDGIVHLTDVEHCEVGRREMVN
jgi:hypothetical protein